VINHPGNSLFQNPVGKIEERIPYAMKTPAENPVGKIRRK
jgi:hypothetical protein